MKSKSMPVADVMREQNQENILKSFAILVSIDDGSFADLREYCAVTVAVDSSDQVLNVKRLHWDGINVNAKDDGENSRIEWLKTHFLGRDVASVMAKLVTLLQKISSTVWYVRHLNQLVKDYVFGDRICLILWIIDNFFFSLVSQKYVLLSDELS